MVSFLHGHAYDVPKRLLDIVLCFIALVISLPVLVFVAVAVGLSSKGPIFYRAKRAGLGGCPITVLKFRTMMEHADKAGTVTIERDNRITPVGKILRKTKLDEMPQLWNILRGEMSIVGPRPESFNIVEAYYSEADRELFTIRPGLTCPGNLLYYVYHEKLRPPDGMRAEKLYAHYLLPPRLLADLHYVRNRSLTYDIALIFQTVWIIFVKWLGRTPRWQPKFVSPPAHSWRTGPSPEVIEEKQDFP